MAEVNIPPGAGTERSSIRVGAICNCNAVPKLSVQPSDLDAKDKVMEEMFSWCQEQRNIVVLKSAIILSSDPTSRAVQNCKSLLLSKGIHPGQVYAATNAFISLLLASGEEEEDPKNKR